MVGNVIQSLFTDANDYPTAGALSVILMVLIVAHGPRLRAPGRDGGAAVIARGIRWIGDLRAPASGCWCCSTRSCRSLVVMLMSFNAPGRRNVYRFDAFTLDNWLHPCDDPSCASRCGRSIEIGFLATLGATILGTLRRSPWCGTTSSVARRPTC